MKCNICEIGMNHLVKDLFQCPKCKLISSNVPSDKTIYDRSYCLKYERYAASRIGNKIDQVRFDTIKHTKKDGSLLDFGCGHGSFIRYCNIKGIKADGFDINPHSEFTDVTTLFNGHKTVTFWDSLEHLAHPKELILGLAPNYLCISTPNIDDFGGPLEGLTSWRHYYPGEHVHYFGYDSLVHLFLTCGYNPNKIHYKESEYRKGGGNKNIITIGGYRR